ncbi:MAG TPA: hypothetical protein VIR55_10895 [Ignavibacteria bacterium]
MKKILIYIFISFFLTSCNLFEPRDAEDPTIEKSNFKPPTTPDIVIENLINSISEKNSINYTQCFGGPNLEFFFLPANEVKSTYYSIFSEWTINSEKSYFDNLVIQTSKDAASNLVLSNQIQQSSSDSVIFSANYTLNFQHSTAGVPQLAAGNLQFIIKRDKNNNWYITRWMDFKLQNQFSWSELKARFVN